MPKTGYVITCNGSVEAIVLGDADKTDKVLRRLREEHRAQWLGQYPSGNYSVRFHWTPRETPIEE